MRIQTLLAGAVAALALVGPAAAQDVAITGGRVLTGTSVIENGTVVVRNGRVVSVGTGAAPAGLRTIAEKLGRATDKLITSTAELEAALEGKHEGILFAMGELREIVDLMEHLVDDNVWPLPKYREMLFIY